MRVVCWFSCGVTSTVATKIALETYPDAIIAYCDTGSEHDDNKRYIKDCEKYFGKEIAVLKSKKYQDIFDVFEKTRWLVGVGGARCTTELKKLVRMDFQKLDDLQVFGFDCNEKLRAEKFCANNPEVLTMFPLIQNNLSKNDCLIKIQDEGIKLPKMYTLGYHNNNCIGCVKGQSGYWNKIRKDFPSVYNKMALVERELNAAINKKYINGKRIRVFLDELDPNSGKHSDLEIQCGLFCGEY